MFLFLFVKLQTQRRTQVPLERNLAITIFRTKVKFLYRLFHLINLIFEYYICLVLP